MCDENAACNDTIGSYNCTCLDGFEGNGFNCTGMHIIEKFNELAKLLIFDFYFFSKKIQTEMNVLKRLLYAVMVLIV